MGPQAWEKGCAINRGRKWAGGAGLGSRCWENGQSGSVGQAPRGPSGGRWELPLGGRPLKPAKRHHQPTANRLGVGKFGHFPFLICKSSRQWPREGETPLGKGPGNGCGWATLIIIAGRASQGAEGPRAPGHRAWRWPSRLGPPRLFLATSPLKHQDAMALRSHPRSASLPAGLCISESGTQRDCSGSWDFG